MIETVGTRTWAERIEGSKLGLGANAVMLVVFLGALLWSWSGLPDQVAMSFGASSTEALRSMSKWMYPLFGWMIFLGGFLPLLLDGLRGRGLTMWASDLTIFAFSGVWFSVASLALYRDVTGSYLIEAPWSVLVLASWLVLFFFGLIREDGRLARERADEAVAE